MAIFPIHGHNQETKNKTAWQVKESVLKPANSNDAFRVDFNLQEFTKLIEGKGIDVCIHRTMYCPNVKSVDAAEHDINCDVCSGDGFLDLHPLKSRMFIQNQSEDTTGTVQGYIGGQSVSCTFPIGVEVQYFTLITLCDFTEAYMQRVLRNPNSDTDILKYKACRMNVLVDQSGVEYYQDTDFSLDVNGNVLWVTGTGRRKPADGLPYSVNYEAHVAFRARKALHVNRFTQVLVGDGQAEHIKLPEQWLLQKDFLIRRKDAAGNDLREGPYDVHVVTTP